MAAECSPGALSCLDQQRVGRCAEDGQSVTLVETCAPGQICLPDTGTCQAQLCTPNTRTCLDRQNAQTCNQDGTVRFYVK